MRVKNSLKNTIYAVISNILIILVGLVTQNIFVNMLGKEYLGINGLFNNIVSMLAVVELGIGPAIIVNLYKPLAENDYKKINQLMNFYKKCYRIISCVVIIIGILILPFLNFFVDTDIKFSNYGGIYIIFLLYVLDAGLSYLLSYKRSLLQADQKNRYINIVHTLSYILMNFIQILILIKTQNFILFLIAKLIFRFLENIIILLITNRKYPYLSSKESENLDKSDQNKIFKNVKGLFFHKIGGYIVLGTDNIIISKFLGLKVVGLYSNYYLIINSVSNLISQIFSALTASVGNLLVTTSKEKTYTIYKNIMFLNFWIYGFAATAMFNIMNPFIKFWLGEEFLLSTGVLVVLVINFYMTGMRSSIGIYKEAAGIYYEDRFIPIIESLINIIASIIFVKLFGLAGVFIGTITSSLIVVFYSLPHFVYKKVFDRSILEYYRLYFNYLFFSALSVGLTYLVLQLIYKFIEANIIRLILSAVLSFVVPCILIIIIFRKKDEFKYFKNLFKEKFGKLFFLKRKML